MAEVLNFPTLTEFEKTFAPILEQKPEGATFYNFDLFAPIEPVWIVSKPGTCKTFYSRDGVLIYAHELMVKYPSALVGYWRHEGEYYVECNEVPLELTKWGYSEVLDLAVRYKQIAFGLLMPSGDFFEYKTGLK